MAPLVGVCVDTSDVDGGGLSVTIDVALDAMEGFKRVVPRQLENMRIGLLFLSANPCCFLGIKGFDTKEEGGFAANSERAFVTSSSHFITLLREIKRRYSHPLCLKWNSLISSDDLLYQ